MDPSSGAPSTNAFEALFAAARAAAGKGPPPVHLWNPPFCGDIDMRIAADGTWFYQGTPIGRPALVALFASILIIENGRYFLVTPVEKVGIAVDDAPFTAVEMAASGADVPVIAFRTNVGDAIEVDADHGLRFERDPGNDGIRPYVHVRRGLWARVARPLWYDLVARGEIRDVEGTPTFGVASAGIFFPIAPAAEIEAAR